METIKNILVTHVRTARKKESEREREKESARERTRD